MALKEGDWVRTSSTGKDYRVKWIGDRMVVLETDDRTRQFLTTIESVRPLFASQSRTTKRLPAQRRDHMKKLFSLVLAAGVVLALAEIGFAQVQTVAGDDGRKQRTVKVEVERNTATVDAIDYENRMGTLRLPDGTIVTFKFGPAVTNSNHLKVGDQVMIGR